MYAPFIVTNVRFTGSGGSRTSAFSLEGPNVVLHRVRSMIRPGRIDVEGNKAAHIEQTPGANYTTRRSE